MAKKKKAAPGSTLLELKKDINVPGEYVRAGTIKTKKEWKKLFPSAFLFDTYETFQNHEWFINKSLPIKKYDGKPNLQREIVHKIFSKRGLMSMTYKEAAEACLKSYKHHLLKGLKEQEKLRRLKTEEDKSWDTPSFHLPSESKPALSDRARLAEEDLRSVLNALWIALLRLSYSNDKSDKDFVSLKKTSITKYFTNK